MASTRKQCAKCPWKVSTNPLDIPNGYSREKHQALRSTIRTGMKSLATDTVQIMACHETHKIPCVGWLDNQLGEGNNLGLRLAVTTGKVRFDPYELDGEQHATFEDTLPDE